MREQLTVLGGRLKALRKKRKMTLQNLADAAGLTAGLISKVENFRTVPSLPVLVNIARVLDADLGELFSGIGTESRKRWLLVRREEQVPVEREEESGMGYRLILEHPLEGTDLQVMLVTIQPDCRREAVSGEGAEFLYVLDGEFDYRLGDESVRLAAGDSLYFDSTLPHAPENRSGKTATLLACYFIKEEK